MNSEYPIKALTIPYFNWQTFTWCWS